MENKGLFIIILMVLFFISPVYGFGVISGYSADRPLEVYRGEIKEVQLYLVPGPGGEEVRVQAELLDDAGIATLIDESLVYSVSQDASSVVNIRLELPEDAAIGTEYAIKFKFTDLSPSEEGGTVSLRTGSVVLLNPRVVRRPRREIGFWWIIILIILIVVIMGVIWFVIRKKNVIKKKTKGK